MLRSASQFSAEDTLVYELLDYLRGVKYVKTSLSQGPQRQHSTLVAHLYVIVKKDHFGYWVVVWQQNRMLHIIREIGI